MSKENFKHQLFEEFAQIGKVLSSGPRLELLEFLAQGERSVESLAKVSGFSMANTSQHLLQLRRAGLAKSRKAKQQVLYSLAEKETIVLLDIMQKIARKNLTEVDRLIRDFLQARDDLEPVPFRDLQEKVQQDSVTIIDVRPPEEYHAGHIEGAVNIPLKELQQHLQSLDNHREIVAYCRGAYCVLAYEAVAILREKGFDVRRLESGFPEWNYEGLPVE